MARRRLHILMFTLTCATLAPADGVAVECVFQMERNYTLLSVEAGLAAQVPEDLVAIVDGEVGPGQTFQICFRVESGDSGATPHYACVPLRYREVIP
jgi:hypothetical protein